MFSVFLKRHGNKGKWVKFATLCECRDACRDFIAAAGIGFSKWDGGEVKDSSGATVARVSYNGRVWEPGEFPTPEIAVA